MEDFQTGGSVLKCSRNAHSVSAEAFQHNFFVERGSKPRLAWRALGKGASLHGLRMAPELEL